MAHLLARSHLVSVPSAGKVMADGSFAGKGPFGQCPMCEDAVVPTATSSTVSTGMVGGATV